MQDAGDNGVEGPEDGMIPEDRMFFMGMTINDGSLTTGGKSIKRDLEDVVEGLFGADKTDRQTDIFN